MVQLLQIEEVWLNRCRLRRCGSTLLQEFSQSLRASIFGEFNTEFIIALGIERKHKASEYLLQSNVLLYMPMQHMHDKMSGKYLKSSNSLHHPLTQFLSCH